MRIVILGATGTAGQHLLRQALAADHEVVAYVRHPSKIQLDQRSTHLKVLQGELFNSGTLAQALQNAQAVLSTLGVSRTSPHHPPSRQLPTLLQVMEQNHVLRYIGLSSAAVSLSGDRKPLSAHALGRLLQLVSPAVVADKRHEYDLLRYQTAIDWTLARPPRLWGHTLTQRYQANLHTLPRLWVSYADVAHFLLSQLTDTRWSRQAPFVA